MAEMVERHQWARSNGINSYRVLSTFLKLLVNSTPLPVAFVSSSLRPLCAFTSSAPSLTLPSLRLQIHLRIFSVCVAALGVVHAAPLNVIDRGPSFEAHNEPSTSIIVVEFIGQYAGDELRPPASRFESEKLEATMKRVLDRQEYLHGRMPHPREFKILNKFKEATAHRYDTKYFECMMQTLDLRPCEPPYLCILQVPYKETDLVPSNLEMRIERLRSGTLLPPVDVLETASGLVL